MIGYEFEFLVREGDMPLSKETFLLFHEELGKRGWETKVDPGTHEVVGSKKDDFYIGSDNGVCVMEINAPPQRTIQEADRQIRPLLQELQSIYHQLGCSILGLDTFPGFYDTKQYHCTSECIDPQCCNKSYIKYTNARHFNAGHHALYVIAANHVWLDVTHDDLIRQWRVFMRLAPVTLAIFANGPIFNNKKLPALEGRDLLWHQMVDTSYPPGDTRFFGFPTKEPRTVSAYFRHLLSRPFHHLLRDGKAVMLNDPAQTYNDFFHSQNPPAHFFDGTPLPISPTVNDFTTLQVVTFPHVRIKYRIAKNATLEQIIKAIDRDDDQNILACLKQVFLEYRAIGAQPLSDISAGPAFLLGLQNNLAEAEALLGHIDWQTIKQLYDNALDSGLSASVGNFKINGLAKKLLAISHEGLTRRGLGEEIHLQPLMTRLEKNQNPAQEALSIWQTNGLGGLFTARDFSFSGV